MKRIAFLHTLALATLLAAPAPLFAQAKTDTKKDSKADAKKDAKKPTKPNPVQTPDVAAPKFRDGEPDAGFIKTHEPPAGGGRKKFGTRPSVPTKPRTSASAATARSTSSGASPTASSTASSPRSSC